MIFFRPIDFNTGPTLFHFKFFGPLPDGFVWDSFQLILIPRENGALYYGRGYFGFFSRLPYYAPTGSGTLDPDDFPFGLVDIPNLFNSAMEVPLVRQLYAISPDHEGVLFGSSANRESVNFKTSLLQSDQRLYFGLALWGFGFESPWPRGSVTVSLRRLSKFDEDRRHFRFK